MDSARDITTGDIIEAEQLWEIEFVDKERYRCIGCGTQLWPASYHRDINKKRPYFTLGASGAHIEPCDIDGEEEIIKRAKSERLGTAEGFPLPFPNKLVLSDLRPVLNQQGEELPYVADAHARTRGSENRAQRANHGHTVKTIRPIAKAFIKYPHDREHLPLHVPECEGNTFATVFWKLGKIMRFRRSTHLYFAELHWKAPTRTDANIEWQLNAGEWDVVHNCRGTSYSVRVNWADWSPMQRNTLEHEIEFARNKAKDSGGTVKAWLFFIGTQDDEDQTLLNVNRYQAICCNEGAKSI
jgi:hypothetical protein